jgi:hypothetical protein
MALLMAWVAAEMRRTVRPCRTFSAVIAVLAVATMTVGARADDPALEYRVKAAYLYKFGAFVEWPASTFQSSVSAVNVCIAGKDPFDGFLDQATQGQKIADRPILVRRLDVIGRDSGCQIAYVGGSNHQSVGEALDALRGAGVLTVTEDGSGGDSGIVRFVTQDNRVRFEIDQQAAERNGLKISSKLLSLAASVRPG